MRIHDISVKYFLKLLVLRRRSTGVFIAGEHDKENDIWDSNVPCGASGAIIMNGKRWKHWRNTRKFIRVLEKLGVDFSDSGDNTDEKSWVNRILEQAAWVSDAGYSSRLLKTQAQINALHSQINPHFLYNTLDTIYMLARINGEEKTMKMIQALSKYLRLSLSKGREIVTVEDELENVKSYMEIQQIRNENLFRYEIECGEELKTRWILKLILQPIVENAVKYGFCDIFEGGLIRISVTEQAGQLTFSVYNNGTPMEEQMAEKLNGLSEIPVSKMKDSFEDKKHGYGVINIITRLRLKYGEDVRFFYESDTNGTVCVIQIPDDGKENSEQ